MSDFPIDTPPPELYHYTSAGALSGMVRDTKVLRATSLGFVNDRDELKEGFALATELLNARAARVEGTDPRDAQAIRNVASRLPAMLDRDVDFMEPATICAFSLSENKDQLSQWRAYCPAHGGYAMGLHTEGLLRNLGRQQRGDWKLLRCRYHDEEKRRFLQSIIDAFFDMMAGDRVNLLETAWANLGPYLAAIKNEAFDEELEWRIVSPKLRLMGMKVRSTEGLLVPYDELTLDRGWIARVVVGPHPDQATAALGARAACGPGIAIERSNTPYRVLR